MNKDSYTMVVFFAAFAVTLVNSAMWSANGWAFGWSYVGIQAIALFFVLVLATLLKDAFIMEGA